MTTPKSCGLVLSAVFILSGCGQAPPPPPPLPHVGVVTLKAEPVALSTELPGRVSAVETSEVRPQVNGILRRKLFTEGSLVHAGQVLYLIDDAPYRASMVSAQGQLARAQATINSTQLQAERYRQLVAINAISRQDADNASATAQQARADVLAQRGLLGSARVNLDYTRVRAPISGRIGRSLYTVGALVQGGQASPLATIQRMDQVYVDLNQSAADVLNLRAAMANGGVTHGGADAAQVQLILPNGTLYPHPGTLRFSDVTVDATTGAVTVRATFPNADGILLPGLYVRARLAQGTKAQGLLVPQAGISHNEHGDATALVVGADNVVKLKIVKTDRVVGNKWLISEGLASGDRVIVEGLVNLHPGAKVEVHPASAVAAPNADSKGQ